MGRPLNTRHDYCCKILVPYRQVRRRGVPAWTQLFHAGALAIGGLDEAAGAADAGSYGFCLGVSKFVRLCDRWTAGVRMVGWSMRSE